MNEQLAKELKVIRDVHSGCKDAREDNPHCHEHFRVQPMPCDTAKVFTAFDAEITKLKERLDNSMKMWPRNNENS